MNASFQRSQLSLSLTPEDEFVPRLETHAREIRRISIAAIYHATSGHPGGSLSCADVMSALYGSELRLDPKAPLPKDRDRFILSKGHAAPTLYATWASFGFMKAKEAM